MICHSCSAQVKDGAKFCGQCGSTLVARCKTCQATTEPGQRYCDECGTSLAVPSQQASFPLAGPQAAAGNLPTPSTALASGIQPTPSTALASGIQPTPSTTLAPGIQPTLSTGLVSVSGPDRRDVTVLFTDVSGFTAMSEKLDPEEVSEIINAFFSVLVEPIYRYGGVVDKYIGDAIMALFGAPVAHEDDPVRAARAAWDMQQAASRFATDLAARTGIELKVRVGLNTGLVVATQVGARQRADYTVLGDTVNLAQRMEANARPGRVLVTAETYRRTRHACGYQALEPIKVKGKEQSIAVYELSGMLPRTEHFGAPEERFVNRQNELGEMKAAWEDARQGRPRIVLVQGEKGLGKSLLARKFIASIWSSGTRVFRARCRSYQQDSPYAMVGGLILSILGLPSNAAPDRTIEVLRERLGDLHPDPERARRGLAHLLGAAGGNDALSDSGGGGHVLPGTGGRGDSLPGPGARHLQTSSFLALNEILLRLSSTGPVILDLEDLHWADPASLDWIRSLLSRLAAEPVARPLLVLAQSRPDQVPDTLFAGADIPVVKVSVEPLKDADAGDLACSVLGMTPGALAPDVRAVIDRVVDRAEGNPFFLTELVQTVVDRGVLERQGATWALLGRPDDEVTLPGSVSAAILARFDALPPDLRIWLQAAAAFGRRASVNLLARVVGADPGPAVGQLMEQGIFDPPRDGEVAFRQSIVQEVAYDNILMAQRRQWHKQIGEAIEAETGDLAPRLGLLAHHFDLAGHEVNAARYHYLLGRANAARYANAEACVAFRSALDWLGKVKAAPPGAALPSRSDVKLALAQVVVSLGNLDEAIYLLDRAAALGGPRPALARTRGDAAERRGDLAAALAAYEEAAGLAAHDRLEHGRALAALANVHRRLGDFLKAQACAKAALEDLGGMGRLAEEAQVHGVVGICLQRTGDLGAAMVEHQMALRLRQQCDDIDGMASSYNNLGTVAKALGRWKDARQYYTKSLTLFRDLGNRIYLAMVLNNLGDLLLEQGEDVLAERHFRESLRLARALGGAQEELLALASLAEVHLERGAGLDALGCVDECLALSTDTGSGEFVPDLRLARGRALCQMGDVGAGQAEILHARSLAEALGNVPFTGIADRCQSATAVAVGDVTRALALAQRSVEILRQAGLPLQLGRSLVALGALSAEPDRSAFLREALFILEPLGAHRDAEQARQALGEAKPV